MNGLRHLFTSFLILLFTASINAQGFQKIFDQPGPDQFTGTLLAVRATQDGGFILYGNQSQVPVLRKLDALGNTLWSKTLTGNYTFEHAKIFELPDGRFLLSNSLDGFSAANLLAMFDMDGDLLWVKNYNGFMRISLTSEGPLVLHRISLTEYRIIQLDAEGNVLFEKNQISSNVGYISGVEKAASGDYFVAMSSANPARPRLVRMNSIGDIVLDTTYQSALYDLPGAMGISPSGNIYMVSALVGIVAVTQVTPDGTLLWTKSYGVDFVFAPRFVVTDDGGFALTEPFSDNPGVELKKCNSNGDLEWVKSYLFDNSSSVWDFNNIPGGGFVFCGRTNNFGYVIKTDPSSVVYPNFIQGRIVRDGNSNCLAEPTEEGLNSWVISAHHSQGNTTFYANTDVNGAYEFNLPDGDYTLNLNPPGIYWAPCNPLETVVLSNQTTLTKDFPVQESISCPLMEVSIGAPFLRRCFNNYFTVNWANKGTVTAEDAQLKIVAPIYFTYENSSLPLTAQLGDTLVFDLGDVPYGTVGQMSLTLSLSCEASLGETYCLEAYVTPDDLCSFPGAWSGAQVSAYGACVGDTSVVFTLKNIGTSPTSNGLEYIITEDLVVLMEAGFDLQAGQEIQITQAANGGFVRLEADQEPAFPYNARPSIHVFGCGSSTAQGAGPVNTFSLNDGNPNVDIFCSEVIGSFDPNDKQGFPIGFSAEHFIKPGTDISYLIRFQNTGTDTAFTVVVRDTLSKWLDPASLRVGAASHPYTWAVSGSGELTFRFDNILLPDSNINEAASHGFIQFEISHRTDIPLGTAIENQAGIFFDFNLPVMTNTTWHTVQENFLTSGLKPTPAANIPFLNANPNPASDEFTIQLPHSVAGDSRLTLYDAAGQALRSQTFSGNTGRINIAQFPSGLYWFDVRNGAGALEGRGKLIIR